MDFPLHDGGYTACAIGGGSPTAGAGNTKGAYVDLDASTAFTASALLISAASAANTASHLYDIAIGAAGSEVVIAANILHGGHSRMASNVLLPIEVPAGSRISARCQSSAGAVALQVRATLIRGGFLYGPPGGQIVTLGANTANSLGTSVDAGGTINTYGAWVQLSASTPADIAALCMRIGNQANAAPLDGAMNYYVDIGVGGAGSEIPIVVGIPLATSTNGSYGSGPEAWLPASIPAGSRVAARSRANYNDATDRIVGLVLLGLVR